jgi:hypothetical protein
MPATASYPAAAEPRLKFCLGVFLSWCVFKDEVNESIAMGGQPVRNGAGPIRRSLWCLASLNSDDRRLLASHLAEPSKLWESVEVVLLERFSVPVRIRFVTALTQRLQGAATPEAAVVDALIDVCETAADIELAALAGLATQHMADLGRDA